jgi:spore coat polysaccharide biosynthesis protein SpsF (cytidylyltransferase family)
MINAIFLTVRTGSTRLPKKALKKIEGLTTIEHLINRLKQSKITPKIILCTTKREEDNELCDIALRNNIDFYRGSETDKIKRWYDACNYFNVENFVNVDGDDLFFDPGLADMVLKMLIEEDFDFIDGQGLYNDAYGINYKAIKCVVENKNNSNTELIKSFFYDMSSQIKIKKITNPPKIYEKKNIRLTLDYPEDFTLFSEVIKYFKDNKIDMKLDLIIDYIEKNNMSQINFHREADWIKNQAKKLN